MNDRNSEEYKFSVSMCVYGGDDPKNFKAAVDSVINQSLPPDEVVIVVDGPIPKETEQVLECYSELSYFKIIRSEKNVGHGEARRIGLNSTTYELVALMDADDISVYNRFEKQIEVFKKDENISIAGGQIKEFIDDTEKCVGMRIVPTDNTDIKKYMQKRCPFNQVTVMFKKTDVMRVGGYIDWFCDEDYYLWIRMAQAGYKFANVGDVLVNVRVGKDMYKRRGGIKYFKSEAKLQKYMYSNGVIGYPTYIANVAKRFVLQVLMPNFVRGYVFKTFARNTEDKDAKKI